MDDAAATVGGESRGAEQTDTVSAPSRTARAPTEGDWKQTGRRDGDAGSDKVDGRAAGRNGVDNSSFDDDGAYRSLVCSAVVDTSSAPTASGADRVPSGAFDGGPSTAKDSGRHVSPPVDERSRLAVTAAATYDGRSTHELDAVSPGGSTGAPWPTRDTRPLIPDDDRLTAADQESALRIVGEVLLPFLLAGLGSVFAGLVLDIVQVRI